MKLKLFLVIFIIGLWAFAILDGRAEHKVMKRELSSQQFSMTTAIASEINQELSDRLKKLSQTAATINPATMSNAAAIQTAIRAHPALLDQFNGGIIAYQSDGSEIIRVASSADQVDIDEADRDYFIGLINESKPSVSKPLLTKTTKSPEFFLVSPILGEQGKAIGALVGTISLNKPNFLEKIIHSNHGIASHFQVIATPQRLVVAATDKSRIMENLPGTESLGKEGYAVLTDRSKVEVLTSAKAIPVADWTIQASQPISEIFAPIHDMLQRLLMVTVVLTVVVMIIFWRILRRQALAETSTPTPAQPVTNEHIMFEHDPEPGITPLQISQKRIRRALKEQEFVLHYQPKVNIRTGAIIGAEALIRWQHPERGLLSPSAFLPEIEDHHLAIDIGEWALDAALCQMEIWHKEKLDLPVSVNIGTRQLLKPNFVDRLRTILAAHPGVKPENLEIEIKEASTSGEIEQASRVVEACKKLGVVFALDDFNSGNSSFSTLKRLPVTLLKIDQTFVRDMLGDPDDLATLDGVIGLANAFHLKIIAEGVETVAHGELLLQLGCELAQGYGIARPMPGDKIPAWAAAWIPDPAWADRPEVNRNDLPLIFANVEHRAWIATIENHIKNKQTPPQLGPHHCRFGKWLDTDGLTRYGSSPAFQAIEPLHRELHVFARELLGLQAKGQNKEAMAKLSELHHLRDAFLEQLKVLVWDSL